MFKKVAIALLCIMSGTTVFAQKYQGYNKDLVEYYTRDLNQIAKNSPYVNTLSTEDLKNIKGSPYENEKFITGDIYKGDTLIATKIPMRYNIVSDQIELKDPKEFSLEPSGALLNNPDLSVKIGADTYRYIENFQTDKGIQGSYFNVLWEGNDYSLYKKMAVDFQPPFKAATTFDNDRPAAFTQREIFYLVKNKVQFTELPTRKSALYKVLGNKKKEIKEYVEKNKLDLDKEQDLAKLIAYYNTLF